MNHAGYRLSSTYSKLLAAFGAWVALGVALIFLLSDRYLFGGISALAAAGMIALAVRGSRNIERAYSRIDLAIQWIMLAVPIILAIVLFMLTYAFFRPFTAYIAIYLAVLVVLAALVARELWRRIPTDNIQ